MKNNLKLEDIQNFKLCYIENRLAFFTNQSLDKQWGDDWNDAPYEHNAGDPYNDNEDNHYIVKLFFEADLREPKEGHYNSPYSVKDINNGAIAWLSSYSYVDKKVFITAGTTVKKFIDKIKKVGGEVFLPISLIKNK